MRLICRIMAHTTTLLNNIMCLVFLCYKCFTKSLQYIESTYVLQLFLFLVIPLTSSTALSMSFIADSYPCLFLAVS